MSPLIGSTGVISEYSYRGNLDYLPDDFNIGADVINQPINVAITRTVASITAINYKAKVSASPAGAEVSVNGAPFSSTAQYVRKNQSVAIRYSPPDYETTYAVTLTVGKKSDTFNITTRQRPEDGIPNAFNFTDQTDIEYLKTNIESNIVTLSGMSNVASGQTPRTYDYGTASISGNGAEFRVTRGGTVVRDYSSSSYQVLNGDQIQLRMNAGGNAQTVSTTFSVSGTDTTNLASPVTSTVSDTWSITTKSYPVSISISARPTTVDYNESTTISWTSQNIKLPITITNVGDMYNTLGSRSSYKLNKGVNGGDVTFTATAETLYSPPSSVPSNTVTVHVNPPPAPSVSLSSGSGSNSIAYNSSTTLSWSSSNATTVNSSTDDFAGSNLIGNNVNTGNLTQSKTYTIKVNGLEGQTASASVTINVAAPPEHVEYISSNVTNIDASSYFLNDWQSSNKKRLVIRSEVVVGSTDPSTPALVIGANVGGAFVLENNGSIQGAPGKMGDSGGGDGGKGGNAIRADAPGSGGSITITNNGSILAGGGGGGGGTHGGSGSKLGFYRYYSSAIVIPYNGIFINVGRHLYTSNPSEELIVQGGYGVEYGGNPYFYIFPPNSSNYGFSPVYRGFYGNSHDHLLTTNSGELGANSGERGGYNYEGNVGDASTSSGTNLVPLYRGIGNYGEHFYSLDSNEITNAGYSFEGPAFYVYTSSATYPGNGGNGALGRGYGNTTNGLEGSPGQTGTDGGGNGGSGGSGGDWGSGGSQGGQGTAGNTKIVGSSTVGKGGASGYSLNGTNYTSISGGTVSGPQKTNP